MRATIRRHAARTATEQALTPRRWLKGLAATERPRLVLATLAGLAVAFATLVQMVLLAMLIDRLLAGQPRGELVAPFLGLAAVLVLRAFAQWAQEVTAQEASLRIRARARDELLTQLARLGPVWLTGRHSAGLGGQLVEQVEALEGYFARFLPQLRLALALPLVVLALVAWLDWLAALFLLLAAPLIPLFMALVGIGAERLQRDQFAAVTRLAGHFLDRVRGITTLQLFGRTTAATEEVFAHADDYRRRNLRTLRLAFLSSAVLEFFASVAIAVVAIYVGFGLLGYLEYGPAPELTLFSGLLTLLLAPEFFQPLRTLSQHYHDRAAALGAADGLVTILNEIPQAGGRRAPASLERHAPVSMVELDGACVAHAGRGRVLGPLSLEVARGEVLALVGPSGAGKSTLLQLIAGFIAPETGRVAVAGEARGEERSGFAWMDQRPLLIQGTLADNLRLVDPDADDARLGRALARAGLGELLATLPEGLETPIAERGASLSGGQAQRLALARVFLSEAPLVLLDEPTASLDAATEAAVVGSLGELAREGRTLVIATHRPALMALADRVVTLEDGRLQKEAPA